MLQTNTRAGKMKKGERHTNLNDSLHISLADRNVPLQSPSQPDIVVGVNKDLHVHQVENPLIIEGKDSLEEDHIGTIGGPCLGHSEKGGCGSERVVVRVGYEWGLASCGS